MTQHDFIGIDMAKDKFDVAILQNGISINSTFNNTKEGFDQFYKWLKEKKFKYEWVCLESTGHYSELLAEFLYGNKIKVSIVNPLRIKQFKKLQLVRKKNDIIDARMIRDFAAIYKPNVFQPRTYDQKQLRELIQLLDTIKQQKTQINNQINNLQTVLAKEEYLKIANELSEKEKNLQKKIKETIEQQSILHSQIVSLTEIKGLGELSAYRIIAYLPDIERFGSAKQLAAYIGVSPKQQESGKYQGKTSMSKLGSIELRKALYMPALSAKCFNEHLQPFVKRLQSNGLKPKAIIGAVMRKLVHIIYGMLKHKQPFNPKLV